LNGVFSTSMAWDLIRNWSGQLTAGPRCLPESCDPEKNDHLGEIRASRA
jgi:hypothetical protein